VVYFLEFNNCFFLFILHKKYMPIYLDRHSFISDVSAKEAAQEHLLDLGIQDQYGCKAITYWFDEVRKVAFCLVEALSKEAVREMHDHPH
jgi:hypothetical protein